MKRIFGYTTSCLIVYSSIQLNYLNKEGTPMKITINETTNNITLLPKHIDWQDVFPDYDDCSCNFFLTLDDQQRKIFDEINKALAKDNICRNAPSKFAVCIHIDITDSGTLSDYSMTMEGYGEQGEYSSYYAPEEIACELNDHEKLLLASVASTTLRK